MASPPTKKQHLAAIRKFFDKLVLRHAILLNPAASARTAKYDVIEGKTPEISVEQARKLLRSINVSSRRWSSRPGRDWRHDLHRRKSWGRRQAHLEELRPRRHPVDASLFRKGGKSREIPVRYDLEQFLLGYLEAARLKEEPKDSPLFRRRLFKNNSAVCSCGITASD